MAALAGFAQLHPAQPDSQAQGALELMHGLQKALVELTGMRDGSLAPLAGAHGELSGILMIKACLEERGQGHRSKILIPDTAHGTNPASAAMGGFDVVSVPSDADGNIDLDAVRREADENLAGVMFTQPTTLGLFDVHAEEMCRIVHEAGGLVYADGANMNALLGRVKLGDLGFDVVHLNLHKTFTTPHGGGGPGAGPVCANETLAPYLPAPVVTEADGVFALARPERTIGRIGAWHGNFGVLVRAYTYISIMGGDGLREVSENAVLNANYLLARLRPLFELSHDRRVMHEVVFSAKKRSGARALDVSKRLLDFGFHAPTMYFPLVIDEALMIEPTETESKETLDAFVEAMVRIDGEAANDASFLAGAPYQTPVARLDEARAAREPNLRWKRPAGA
jgi:glycine dehydrogenase subunit 2